MLDKKTNKRFVVLLACLLSLPNMISANPEPPESSYLDLVQKSLQIVSTGASAALSIVMIKQILSQISGSSESCYQDWTNQSKNSSGLPLTADQEKFLTNLLHNIGSDENPHAVITGDAGSGKTTIVRAFATKTVHKDRALKDTPFNNAVVWSVNADTLNSSSMIGSLGSRFKHVWNAAKNYHKKTGKKVILFFDEFHRLIHLGNHSTSSTSNLSELLKTLTGNKADYCGVHIIGATTSDEYKTYVAPNGTQSAIARRFPKYPLPPISDQDALVLLNAESWHYQKKHHVFIPEKELGKISQECIKRSKHQPHKHPNPDRLKKLFGKMMVQSAKEKHQKNLKETEPLHEEINYMEKRIGELAETQDKKTPVQAKKTWINWLISCLWSLTKTEPETSPSIAEDIAAKDKSVNQIKTVFHEKESTESERKSLCDDLWELNANLEESGLTNTTKNNLRKELRQALQIQLQIRRNKLKIIKYKRVKIKAILIGHARLTAEKQRLTQQQKAGMQKCTSPLIQEKHIDKAIHQLSTLMQRQETKLLNFDDKAKPSSVILDHRHACQLLQQVSSEERLPSQALLMYM